MGEQCGDDDDWMTCKCDNCGCQIVIRDLEAYFDKLLCGECLHQAAKLAREIDAAD
jgi:hypothetical protein